MKNIILFSLLFSFSSYSFMCLFFENKNIAYSPQITLEKGEGIIKYKLYHGESRHKNLELEAKLSIKARFYTFKKGKLLCESLEKEKSIYGFYDYFKKKSLPNCLKETCKVFNIDDTDGRKYTIKKLKNENVNGYDCEKFQVTSPHPTGKNIETQYIWVTQAFSKKSYYLPIQEKIFDDSGMLVFNPQIKGFPIKIETPMYMPQASLFMNPSDMLTVVYEFESFEEKKINDSIFDRVISRINK